MKAALRALVGRAVDAIVSTRVVPIQHCYHYRAFRYGGFGRNPYEDYIVGLARGRDLPALRAEFAALVLAFRPGSLGAALQIDIPQWPMWEYPWARRPAESLYEIAEQANNPDVMCFSSPGGVLASQINREFGWLEGAWNTISTMGYQPRRFGHIRCIELAAPAQSSYLVLDGNHRLSALHAMGFTEVEVELVRLRRVRRRAVANWPRVRDGSLSVDMALRVFDRYFATQNPVLPNEAPAPLIADEPALWPLAHGNGTSANDAARASIGSLT